MSKKITVTEAARVLGVSKNRVRFLITAGILKGQKVTVAGQVPYWLVTTEAVEDRKSRKPGPGRPKKIREGA